MGEPHHEHRSTAPKAISCAVLTISDTRTMENDEGGRILAEGLAAAGHEVTAREILKDEPERIVAAVATLAERGVKAIVLTGGTGITRRDGTYEAVASILEKRLDGFGEIFRYLSYLEIGSAAILSRAQAGLCRGSIVISVPGSPAACRLALEKLILPELRHMVREASR
ncbi:MAG: molybdenum cofactor biosynthesis protein B [Acidobacteriota bacterium]